MTTPSLLLLLSLLGAASPMPFDTARIEQSTGAKGTFDEKEGTFKVTAPRRDLSVVVGSTAHLSPPMGLTSWATFQRVGDATAVMGDMVLEEGQVSPVMSAALDAGLEVTALHNHFLWESPRVMFMHIDGHGDTDPLARAVGKVFATIRETAGSKAPTLPSVDPAKGTLDGAKIESALGRKGQLADGVYKVTIGRTTHAHGAAVGNTMGVNTWAAFAGVDDSAVVDGDFAMLETELQPVLKALRGAGIHVVAIHHHMTGETPRIVFLHYWGAGPAADLARGLKAALAQTAQ
jgi:hypothetical protein